MIPAATPSGDRVPLAKLASLAQLFQAGRHAEMEASARQLTTTWPGDGIAWKALGTALLALGRDALAPLERARELLPQDVEVLGNLGVVLGRLGRWADAAACHRSALGVRPTMAEAHCNLADALAGLGDWAGAAASSRAALRIRPNFAAASANLGRAQFALGQPADAADSYRQALAIHPALVQAHHGLALAWLALGRDDAALAALREALRLQPRHAAAGFELAVLAARLGHRDEAESAYRHVLAIDPERVDAWARLGDLLTGQGRHAEAVEAFAAASRLRPEEPALLGNLGNALLADGRVEDALQKLQSTVDAAPDDAVARGNLAHALVVVGQPARALPHLERAIALQPNHLDWQSAALFTRQYLDARPEDRRRTLTAARRYGAAAAARARPFIEWTGLAEPDKRLRIGWVSGDLRTHPVAWFLQSVLSALSDRPGLEMWAYATRPAVDDVTRALRPLFARWQHVDGDDDAALAERIHRDGIDVLIDLSGHTRHNRLPVFAWRPAPLQWSWLGSCASTGLAEIDAVVVDPWIAPPGAEDGFVEPLWRLPRSFLCFTPPAAEPEGSRTKSTSIDGPLRLACFNRLAKIGEAVLVAWARILTALPQATLVLQDRAFGDPAFRNRWLRRLACIGIDAPRLSLLPGQSRPAYLASYLDVDLALDPFPYPGGTTSLEALWMGVPVLTLAGDSPLARQGVTILQNIGLTDWIATDVDDYVGRAIRLGQARAELGALKAGLRDRLLASPLCDGPRFAASLESAWRAGWRQRCADHPRPRS